MTALWRWYYQMSDKQNNTKAFKILFKKYLRNEVTEQERKAIETWYASLDELDHGDLPLPKRKWFNLPVVKYSASLLLVGGLIFFYIRYNSSVNVRDAQLYTTTADSIKSISLADGSTVLLNKSASLRVSKDFNGNERKVELIGEAFFKIAKDKSRPFVIQSGNLKTTVLGTSFNISAYPDIAEIKIAVASGKVKVSKIGKDDIEVPIADGMIKNQILVYDTTTQLAQLKTGDVELLSAWSTRQLYIDDVSIENIAKQLSRHYGIKVNLDPSLSDPGKYTIMLGQEPLKASIDILSALTRHNFYIKQNQLFIMSKK